MAARLWGAGVASRQCAVALCVLAALSVRASAQTPPSTPHANPRRRRKRPPLEPHPARRQPYAPDCCAACTVEYDGASDHQRFRPAFAAASPAQCYPAPSRAGATPTPAPPSPYQTGAPNVAGGTPVVPQMASQMVISGANLNSRPVTEPAEILEAAPGLAVVQHSGSGKANQYYLRGYNLDHGTDMATFWDDVPINLPTNAHGQGYTDLNFLIPETISGLEVRKGPYWADVGDFDNAGALNISLRDSIGQNIQSVTARQLRIYATSQLRLGQGRRRLTALCR